MRDKELLLRPSQIIPQNDVLCARKQKPGEEQSPPSFLCSCELPPGMTRNKARVTSEGAIEVFLGGGVPGAFPLSFFLCKKGLNEMAECQREGGSRDS